MKIVKIARKKLQKILKEKGHRKKRKPGKSFATKKKEKSIKCGMKTESVALVSDLRFICARDSSD